MCVRPLRGCDQVSQPSLSARAQGRPCLAKACLLRVQHIRLVGNPDIILRKDAKCRPAALPIINPALQRGAFGSIKCQRPRGLPRTLHRHAGDVGLDMQSYLRIESKLTMHRRIAVHDRAVIRCDGVALDAGREVMAAVGRSAVWWQFWMADPVILHPATARSVYRARTVADECTGDAQTLGCVSVTQAASPVGPPSRSAGIHGPRTTSGLRSDHRPGSPTSGMVPSRHWW